MHGPKVAQPFLPPVVTNTSSTAEVSKQHQDWWQWRDCIHRPVRCKRIWGGGAGGCCITKLKWPWELPGTEWCNKLLMGRKSGRGDADCPVRPRPKYDENRLSVKDPAGLFVTSLFNHLFHLRVVKHPPPPPKSRRCVTSHNPTRQICHNLCWKHENLGRLCRQQRQWRGDQEVAVHTLN